VIRTLPLQLDPIPGEALDSWLAALAHRSHTAWADMLTAAGLGTAAQRSSAPTVLFPADHRVLAAQRAANAIPE
jgi:hypothetical protein